MEKPFHLPYIHPFEALAERRNMLTVSYKKEPIPFHGVYTKNGKLIGGSECFEDCPLIADTYILRSFLSIDVRI